MTQEQTTEAAYKLLFESAAMYAKTIIEQFAIIGLSNDFKAVVGLHLAASGYAVGKYDKETFLDHCGHLFDTYQESFSKLTTSRAEGMN